mmetsp:Transcript_28919/g.62018  ORF Transcript_28919/g.62018 Transcript_28919/m.62018 type:complete len:298 (-) Transcript_28919:212-1105(-)
MRGKAAGRWVGLGVGRRSLGRVSGKGFFEVHDARPRGRQGGTGTRRTRATTPEMFFQPAHRHHGQCPRVREGRREGQRRQKRRRRVRPARRRPHPGGDRRVRPVRERRSDPAGRAAGGQGHLRGPGGQRGVAEGGRPPPEQLHDDARTAPLEGTRGDEETPGVAGSGRQLHQLWKETGGGVTRPKKDGTERSEAKQVEVRTAQVPGNERCRHGAETRSKGARGRKEPSRCVCNPRSQNTHTHAFLHKNTTHTYFYTENQYYSRCILWFLLYRRQIQTRGVFLAVDSGFCIDAVLLLL